MKFNLDVVITDPLTDNPLETTDHAGAVVTDADGKPVPLTVRYAVMRALFHPPRAYATPDKMHEGYKLAHRVKEASKGQPVKLLQADLELIKLAVFTGTVPAVAGAVMDALESDEEEPAAKTPRTKPAK